MQIVINNKVFSFNSSQNLEDVMKNMNCLQPQGIAVAVNYQVIPKKKWAEFELNENDKLTIIKATQGG